MKKTTVKSPSNIALIKYWGKADPKTRLPLNSSLSICLDSLYSLCTVEFSSTYPKDDIKFLGEKSIKLKEITRIQQALNKVRMVAGITHHVKVRTQNNFPKAVGIASSASGLSALAYAALTAAGQKLSQRELTIFCRQLSGSSARSIPDGFVEWYRGENNKTSYAESIFPPDHWDIVDLVVVITSSMKKISSTQGHALSDTSPIQHIIPGFRQQQLKRIKLAISQKDFTTFGQILETDAMILHAVCLTSQPPIIYWHPDTIAIMHTVLKLRESGIAAYFTIDAGPSVHIITRNQDVQSVRHRLLQTAHIQQVVINRPSQGARIVSQHLF